ncbi:MAG: ADP-heptose--lipopolysaccharide heptosyltransferase [Chthonomonadaceae bacterium]|nr:ADP-heptose--lipopolysaccharide heptosyltransferase [Chthonomonadaceae bacterium]
MPSPPSILVMTREHIGDLVCTTPALRSLRHLYPESYIVAEVGERAACVLENCPYVDEIVLRPHHQGLTGKAQFIRLLRQRRFDIGVVLDNSADMILYLRLGGVVRRVGMIRKKRFSQFLTDSVPFDPMQHEMIDNFRNVVALLGADVSDPQPELFPTSQDIARVDALFAEYGLRPEETLIALNPGASAPANRWLPERFAEVGDLLAQRPQTRILLLGSSGDLPIIAEVLRGMKTAPVVLTGQLSVLQLAETLRRCSLMITNDTGPMHIGCAMRTPIVAIFGPAVPYESGPGYVPGNIVLRNVTGCPNCTKYDCRDDRRCMQAVTTAEVAAAAEKQLELHQPALESVR